MRTVVISQPMFFPWAGLFEQVKIADYFVHYTDVAMPQGRSFVSRVQVKGPQGVSWLSVPTVKPRGMIDEVRFDETRKWRVKHFKQLESFYSRAAYRNDMLNIVDQIYFGSFCETISQLNVLAIEKISLYLGLAVEFRVSKGIGDDLASTDRLVEITKFFGGDCYVTGWGARNYLEATKFGNIRVELMDYSLTHYRQLHGEFTPYVSILDLIANEGPNAHEFLNPRTIQWDEYRRQKEHWNESAC